jgi:ferrous iron transport protein B
MSAGRRVWISASVKNERNPPWEENKSSYYTAQRSCGGGCWRKTIKYWERDGSKSYCGAGIMKRILLMGNPNVGKSVVFSRLTGANVIASNYPGTTIEYTAGVLRVKETEYEIIDVPGTYSLQPTNKAEEVATKMIEKGDIVINVVDATNLERNLYLTCELLEKDIPVVVALNVWDEAVHSGITIDVKKLEEHLGVPVVCTVALTGEGFKTVVSLISHARPGNTNTMTEDERWSKIGRIVRDVQTIERKHHTIKETISDITIKPVTGLPIALGVIIFIFWLVRFIGEGIIAYITEPVFEIVYTPVMMKIHTVLPPGLLHDILIGDIIDGHIAYMESMGVLTTGIFVPFGAVLPYIIAFYTGLSLLEDSGYLPRLATLMDNIFHQLGMHGYGVVPIFLGLGCNVPGALSTRSFETKRERLISATLLSIAVPCMAQIAMIFGILGVFGMKYIYMVIGTLLCVYVIVGLILKRVIPGTSPEIFLEIPPYRMPSGRTIAKKTFTRVKWFIKEAVPWLFVGIVLINGLYAVGALQFLGKLFEPVIVGLFGLPAGAVSALLVGFLRKDLAVGMLLGLGMGPLQLVIATTILTMYFPCAATFAVLFKELGVKDLLKSVSIMITAVLIVGSIMRLILLGV